MAIQPDIALQVKPMQINDPLETAGKVLSIRGAQQNQALGAQQLQAGALHLQQQQMEMADQQTLRQALIANNGDREAALKSVVGKINPATYNAGIEAVIKQKKELGDLDKQKREALDFQLGKVSDALAPVLQAPPEQKAAVYQQGIGFLKAHGVDTSQMNPEYTNDEDIQASLAHANGYLKMSEEVRKQAEEKRAAAKAPVELAKLGSEATAAQQKATGTEPIQPFQTATLAGQAETRAQTAAHNTATEANAEAMRKQGSQRLGIEQTRLKMQQEQMGFDQNGGVSQTARAAVSGDLDPQTVRSMLRRNPGLIEQMKRVDPEFDEANIERRYGTLKEFNSTSNSKAGGQVLALNTLIHHAELYQQVAESLKNGSFRPGNAAYNAVANAFGAAPPTQANLVARFLAGETGKVATGGVPAEGEINGILKSLGSDASPDQIKQAGATLLQVAAGRATPLMERVKEAKLDKVVRVLGNDAQEILKRRGINPETMKPAGTGAKAPAVGAIEDGHKFKGGDPADSKNWEKQ